MENNVKKSGNVGIVILIIIIIMTLLLIVSYYTSPRSFKLVD